MSELETIIAALNGLGAEIKSTFIVWLAITYGAKIITSAFVPAVFITLFVVAARTTRWCVAKFWEHAND